MITLTRSDTMNANTKQTMATSHETGRHRILRRNDRAVFGACVPPLLSSLAKNFTRQEPVRKCMPFKDGL